MIEPTTVARSYARAVFQIAKQSNDFATWSALLETLSLITQHPKVQVLLQDRSFSIEKMEAFFEHVCQGRLTEPGRNLILLLGQKRRLSLFPKIALLFEKMRLDEDNRESVEVTTALPLNEQQTKEFELFLGKIFGKTMHLKNMVDPDILGGYIARVGDIFIDSSIKTRLKQLKNAMGG